MANTWGYDVFRSPVELRALDKIALDPTYIALGTGNTQGGKRAQQGSRRGLCGPRSAYMVTKTAVCDPAYCPSSLPSTPAHDHVARALRGAR